MVPEIESTPGSSGIPSAERVRIGVVAGAEEDRTALSSAISTLPRLRVVCSVPLEGAGEVIAREPLDALVGFVDDEAEWVLFRSLAEQIPDTLTVLLVSDPDRIDAVADGSVLNAVVPMPRTEVAVGAGTALSELDLPGVTKARADDADRRKLDGLSEREQEILALTAEGLAIKEIARRLSRSYGTVATHRVNIMEKLSLHDRVALTRFAIRTGLIEA